LFRLLLLYLPVLTSSVIHHSIQIFTSLLLQGLYPDSVMRLPVRVEDFPSSSFISFSVSYLLVIYGFVFIVASKVCSVSEDSWSGVRPLLSLFHVYFIHFAVLQALNFPLNTHTMDIHWYIYLLTYLLTPWCRILFEIWVSFSLSKNILLSYETRRFITVFTQEARHWILSWASWIQFAPSIS
jgi:hypothetical protein